MSSEKAIGSGGGGEQRHEPGSRLFSVRLWKEELASGSEYRGSVRDVSGERSRAFRDWSDLITFMVARLEHDVGAERAQRKEKL